VYHRSLASLQVRVAEIFKPAIQRMAPQIICVHDHPLGDPASSTDDITVTHTLVQAGKLLNVELLDHLVIEKARFISLRGCGLGFD